MISVIPRLVFPALFSIFVASASSALLAAEAPGVTGLPATLSFTEDTQGNVDIAASTFSDADSASIIVRLSASAGTFGLALGILGPGDLGGNGTSTVSFSGSISDVNQHLDTPSNVTYTPAANAYGTAAATITVSVSDDGGTNYVSVGSIAIDISAANDAPVLTSGGALTAVNQDTASPAGAALNTLGITANDTLDGGSISGYAIVANAANATTQGAWQYSTNAGANWHDVRTTVSNSAALKLSASTLVRLLPVAGYHGTPGALTIRALDGNVATFSDGGATETRQTVDTTTNGGTTAISAATANITTSVTDTLSPAVTSVGVPSNATYVASQNLDFTVNWNENVVVNTGGGTPTISLTIGSTARSATYVSGTGTTALLFRYTTQAGDFDNNGIAVGALALNGGTIKDTAGNNATLTLNSVGSTASVNVDAAAPSVTARTVPSDGTYKIGQHLDLTVTYSENVTVIGTPYIAVTLSTGGSVQASYNGGTGTSTLTFRYTVASGNLDADGIAVADAITLNSGTIKDGAGNDAQLTTLGFATTAGVLVDSVAPAVSSSNRSTPSSSSTNATSVVYRVTFSEAVTGVDVTDFSLTKTGTADGSIASVSAVSGAIYDVTVNSISGAGTLRLDLNNSGTGIADSATNAITAGYTSGQTYSIDSSAPAVSSVSVPTNATYGASQNLDFTVNWNENVNVDTTGGTPAIALTIGSTARSATYVSGNGTSALLFRYTIQTSDTDTDGVTVGAMSTGGGTLKDAAGNDASLTLNSVGSTASVLVEGRQANAITFSNPGAQNFGTAPTLSATAGSGDAVVFTSSTTGVCTVTSGGALTFVTAGTCTINADEDGNATYSAAPQVSRSFTVNAVVPGAPTIGSATASNTQATVAFTAPASNGGSAITSYTVTSSPGNISATGAGSPITVTGLTNGVAYTFTAKAENSAGTGSASAASNSVTPKASNTITFSNPGAQNFGTTPVLTATATSTDTVTFSSATTGVCTITSSGALTFVTAGTCTIRADEDGTASYLAATQVSQSFTVNAVVPGAPTIGTATAGDTLATVSFTAPASNGGVAITGYTVTSTPGHITANGTSSPITVAGLTNGTAYTFTVTATNSIGTGSASAASNSVAPAAPPPSPPESNPFNPGGTQTQTNLDPATGVVPTRAPNDIVTNIGNLDNRVGISDNGVVVVLDNGLREPVKFRDNPPDNVLISMPSRKPLVVQLGGNTLNIHVDPETPNPPTQTILGTTTLQLPGGTSANGLQLVQGEVTIGNDAPGAPIGGMDLSKDTTLRSLVAQSGQDGGTAGFRKGLDGAGSVSAESGEVRITVRLKNTGISTLSQAIALPGFTAPPAHAAATDTLTLTLQAGEVARFDALGELDGVFLGSLSGKMGKTGDTLAMTAPAGVAGYPASTLVFDGGNVPARIGMAFSDFMNAQLDDQLHFSQRADGVMQVKSSGGGEFYARTIRGFEVVEGAADGASANGDGSLSLTYGGIRSTWQPMLEDAADLSAYAAALGAYVTDVLENGNVQLSGATTHFFVARPRHALRNVFGRTQGIAPVAPGDSSLFYTNARGAQQQLDPAFHDEAQLRIAAAAQGWTLTRSGLGGNNLTASSPDGVEYQVVPDFRVDVLGADTGLRGVIRQEGSKLYFYYSDEPLRQGFTLRAR